MDKNQHQVLTILMMRFGLSPYKALPLTSHWLQTHPTASWETLNTLLLRREVIFVKGILHDVTPTQIKILTLQMRRDSGIKIKNRWYSCRFYPQCFIGSEAVDWFVKTQKVTRLEAIQIGEMLIARQIIHHVHDDHNFKDEYLFYRFYIDETQGATSQEDLASKNFFARTIVI